MHLRSHVWPLLRVISDMLNRGKLASLSSSNLDVDHPNSQENHGNKHKKKIVNSNCATPGLPDWLPFPYRSKSLYVRGLLGVTVFKDRTLTLVRSQKVGMNPTQSVKHSGAFLSALRRRTGNAVIKDSYPAN